MTAIMVARAQLAGATMASLRELGTGTRWVPDLEDFESPIMKALRAALPKNYLDVFWYDMSFEKLEVAPELKFSQILDLNYNFKYIEKSLEKALLAGLPGKEMEVSSYGCSSKEVP